MTQTVVGFFDKSSDADQAVNALVGKGFTRDNIQVSTGDDIAATGTGDNNSNTGSAGEGSGISRFFKNLFGDNDDDANRYSTVASRSNSMVTVYAQSEDEAESAADILDENGAVNVDEKSGEYGIGSNAAANATDTKAGTAANAGQSIKVIEENLEVGKKTVQTGGVRLRSRIVEHPVEEQVRLRQENVTVNRNTVNRLATDADFAAFKEGNIEMIETAEVPVVSKQARVVEEVSLDKNVTDRNETVKDTVRKTEVDVENIAADKSAAAGTKKINPDNYKSTNN